jgi:hypothetical protein
MRSINDPYMIEFQINGLDLISGFKVYQAHQDIYKQLRSLDEINSTVSEFHDFIRFNFEHPTNGKNDCSGFKGKI